ncbi:small integral membrane protein 8-like [Saccoglossus kowalevskii]|uniref:Small integral membrane protein 8 n=1 Tax=Saccoglossus kowalevskii TaxID=10224 RepID=A0ABM0GPD9_SACKO|nr:PREDICTED: small integral membrane protein 8-like [Saccoglossus kowalevskii]
MSKKDINTKGSANKTSQRTPAPGDGIRGVRTTSLFKAVNFELFVKPNKVVMIFGVVAITCCVSYIAYMNATAENRKMYEAYNVDGTTVTKYKKSKWD